MLLIQDAGYRRGHAFVRSHRRRFGSVRGTALDHGQATTEGAYSVVMPVDVLLLRVERHRVSVSGLREAAY
jgi:hypothetical protein